MDKNKLSKLLSSNNADDIILGLHLASELPSDQLVNLTPELMNGMSFHTGTSKYKFRTNIQRKYDTFRGHKDFECGNIKVSVWLSSLFVYYKK